jgi:hypothetical protein
VRLDRAGVGAATIENQHSEGKLSGRTANARAWL